jgi:hypothetical protein
MAEASRRHRPRLPNGLFTIEAFTSSDEMNGVGQYAGNRLVAQRASWRGGLTLQGRNARVCFGNVLLSRSPFFAIAVAQP